MQLEFTADEVAFRDEVRSVSCHELSRRIAGETGCRDRARQGGLPRLAPHRRQQGLGRPRRGRWSTAAPGWTPTQRYIWSEELARRHRADPAVLGQHGRAGDLHLRHARAEGQVPARHRDRRRLVVPGLFRAGRRLRPRLAEDAERTRDGDHYVVNGQKTWTTLGQHADWGFFLVRTDPAAKPQEGISFLLIDMKSPGRRRCGRSSPWTARTRSTRSCSRTCSVPVENRIYEENKGWTCAKFLLAHERTGIAGVARSKRGLEKLQGHRRRERRRRAAAARATRSSRARSPSWRST